MKRDKTWKINARRIRRGLLALAVILLAGAGISLWRSKYALEVTRASFPWPGTETVRIVQLTDLHNSVFGKDNEKLVQTVAGEDPDLILITGDLVDQNSASSETAVSLVRKLAAIAPVYISYGNHEAGFDRRYGADLAEEYEAAGAEVLDFAWQEITVRGEKIRLGGIFGYCLPEKYLRTNEADERECAFLKEFQDTEEFTLLMAHMPACWIVNGGISAWNVDLVLAGHVHGGQIRLPFIGGLYAPDQGWFPGEEAGFYWSDDGERAMFLSRGLGSTEKIPRFWNVPEVVSLTLAPET